MMTGDQVANLIRDLERMRDDGETSFEVIVDRAIARLKEQRNKYARATRRDSLKFVISDHLRELAEQSILLSSQYFGVNPDVVRGRCRTRTVVRARQVAMAAIRADYPDSTLHQIASLFGRDHSTVLYACNIVAGDTELRNAKNIIRMRRRDAA